MERITVPANILLLGEYAVLEEGGIGVALAVEPRVEALLTTATRLELAGNWGGGSSLRMGSGEPGLFECSVEAVAEFLSVTREELLRLPLRVEIDSSSFYDAAGKKRGFGSSAATAVAVCRSILEHAGSAVEPAASGKPFERPVHAAESDLFLLEATFACALHAHRSFQGGRGSGYDVAASAYGGIGRFTGGAAPRFERTVLPWLPPLALFRGRSPVKTGDAVGRYETWKSSHPSEARRFLERSNECVEGFLAAVDWGQAAAWVEAARGLSAELGAAIGVPATIAQPAGHTGVAKAVGAGNELGVLFERDRQDTEASRGSTEYFPLEITAQGVVWETDYDGRGDDERR